MSQFSYTKKPDWLNDGAKDRATASAQTYPSALGWVAGSVGKGKITTSMTVTANTTCTVVQTGHGLSANQYILVTDATPSTLNGYVQVSSVTDANTFVYTTLANSSTASVQGTVFKSVEVVVACSDLRNAGADISVVPTYTAAVSTPDGVLTNMVVGKTFRITITPSEPVEVRGAAKVQFVVGAGASVRQAIYNQTESTSSSLVFDYVVATGDTSSAGQVVVAAATNGGQIADILPKSRTSIVTVAFTSPTTSTVVFQ